MLKNFDQAMQQQWHQRITIGVYQDNSRHRHRHIYRNSSACAYFNICCVHPSTLWRLCVNNVLSCHDKRPNRRLWSSLQILFRATEGAKVSTGHRHDIRAFIFGGAVRRL